MKNQYNINGKKTSIYFSFLDKAKVVDKEYTFLSNFFESPFTENGLIYKTVEHYYQSNKTQDSEHINNITSAKSPLQAKRLGRKCIISPLWDQQKISIMKRALTLKFSQNLDLKQKLLETQDKKLCEYSRRDKFWGGSCKNSINTLGNLLMEVRKDLS